MNHLTLNNSLDATAVLRFWQTVEQIIKADRGRVSQPLQKEQSRRHAGGGLIPPFYSYNKLMNKNLPISTEYIQQAVKRGRGRHFVSCRESTVRTCMGLVSEYSSMCLADDTNSFVTNNNLPKNIVPNNKSAKQCYSFPILMQAPGTFMLGLLNCVW